MKAVTIIAGIENYIIKLQQHSDQHYKAHYPILFEQNKTDKYSYTRGKRYYKIITTNNQTQVFAFIDANTGDIYKAATWHQPAKGARGNIFNDQLPLTLSSLYRNTKNK